MTARTSLVLALLLSASATAACTAESGSLASRGRSAKRSADDAEDATSAISSPEETPGSGATTPSTNKPGALPALTPRQGTRLRDARRVWGTQGSFTGQAPTVRADDRHATPVTGKDCMACHGGAGTAPRFAFAGTVAAGRQWSWAPAGWRPPRPERAEYDDYDSDDYAYDDYGYDDDDDYAYDDYEDYDDYGYDGRPRKGWPSVRDAAAPGAEIRIVDDKGYVFETVTDADGNFWFRTDVEVAAPAFTGLRKGTFTITGRSNGMACGGCHESGAKDSPGRIWTWDGALPRR